MGQADSSPREQERPLNGDGPAGADVAFRNALKRVLENYNAPFVTDQILAFSDEETIGLLEKLRLSDLESLLWTQYLTKKNNPNARAVIAFLVLCSSRKYPDINVELKSDDAAKQIIRLVAWDNGNVSTGTKPQWATVRKIALIAATFKAKLFGSLRDAMIAFCNSALDTVDNLSVEQICDQMRTKQAPGALIASVLDRRPNSPFRVFPADERKPVIEKCMVECLITISYIANCLNERGWELEGLTKFDIQFATTEWTLAAIGLTLKEPSGNWPLKRLFKQLPELRIVDVLPRERMQIDSAEPLDSKSAKLWSKALIQKFSLCTDELEEVIRSGEGDRGWPPSMEGFRLRYFAGVGIIVYSCICRPYVILPFIIQITSRLRSLVSQYPKSTVARQVLLHFLGTYSKYIEDKHAKFIEDHTTSPGVGVASLGNLSTRAFCQRVALCDSVEEYQRAIKQLEDTVVDDIFARAIVYLYLNYCVREALRTTLDAGSVWFIGEHSIGNVNFCRWVRWSKCGVDFRPSYRASIDRIVNQLNAESDKSPDFEALRSTLELNLIADLMNPDDSCERLGEVALFERWVETQLRPVFITLQSKNVPKISDIAYDIANHMWRWKALDKHYRSLGKSFREVIQSWLIS